MSRLRQTIARRLKDAQNTAAMLTTFNEVDMSAVMALRNQYKELFEKRHGVKLGFMGFFVKAVIQALKDVPAVNAEIDGEDLVYKNYYHVGVAVGTERGLVVPVVRDADRLDLAGVEHAINDLGRRARASLATLCSMPASPSCLPSESSRPKIDSITAVGSAAERATSSSGAPEYALSSSTAKARADRP